MKTPSKATTEGARMEEGRWACSRTRWSPAALSVVQSAVVGAILLLCSCSLPRPNDARLPPAAKEIPVKMSEYSFHFDPAAITEGRRTFRVLNTGRLGHNLLLYAISDGAPSAKAQLEANDFSFDTEIAGVFTQSPGGSDSFAADLSAGKRYLFVCQVRDADNKAHYEKGMIAEFKIP